MTNVLAEKRQKAIRRCADARERLKHLTPARGELGIIVTALAAALDAIRALDAELSQGRSD